jgi:hypothetical protein
MASQLHARNDARAAMTGLSLALASSDAITGLILHLCISHGILALQIPEWSNIIAFFALKPDDSTICIREDHEYMLCEDIQYQGFGTGLIYEKR